MADIHKLYAWDLHEKAPLDDNAFSVARARFGTNTELQDRMLYQAILMYIEAVSSTAGHSIPEGWKLVPTEPTIEMVIAVVGKEAGGFAQAYAAGNYRVMLSVAPAMEQLGKRLPPFPKAMWNINGVDVFTEHQMQGYANSALVLNDWDLVRDIAIEQCAEEADDSARQYAREAQGGDNSGASDHKEASAREIAADIRALKSRAF